VRVFLDANILFSAAYRLDAGLRKIWRIPQVALITSGYAAEEARRNLDQPRQLHDLEDLLRDVEVITTTPADRPLSGALDLAEKDRPILLSAIECRSTHLLTGDFKHFGPYYGQTMEGVLILPPSEFLRRIT